MKFKKLFEEKVLGTTPQEKSGALCYLFGCLESKFDDDNQSSVSKEDLYRWIEKGLDNAKRS